MLRDHLFSCTADRTVHGRTDESVRRCAATTLPCTRAALLAAEVTQSSRTSRGGILLPAHDITRRREHGDRTLRAAVTVEEAPATQEAFRLTRSRTGRC